MRIKKGDQVKIIAGKDRGKTGAVIKVSASENRLTIEGVNTYKKRMRPKRQGQKGETVLVVRSIDASNALLICKNCKKAVRLGMRKEGETKVRFCRKCEAST